MDPSSPKQITVKTKHALSRLQYLSQKHDIGSKQWSKVVANWFLTNISIHSIGASNLINFLNQSTPQQMKEDPLPLPLPTTSPRSSSKTRETWISPHAYQATKSTSVDEERRVRQQRLSISKFRRQSLRECVVLKNLVLDCTIKLFILVNLTYIHYPMDTLFLLSYTHVFFKYCFDYHQIFITINLTYI